MNRYDFTAVLKSQGRGDSATQPKTVQMLLCRQLHFLSFLQHSLSFIYTPANSTAETGPQVPKVSYRTGSENASPVQSCGMSIFSHPVQILQYGTILHLWCNPYSQQQITRIMVNGKNKTTNKTEKDARVLTSVYFLSYHSLKLLSNSIKKRQNRSIPVDIF